MRRLILLLASGGYTGYAPFASGTVGTLVAIPLFWLFAPLQAASVPLSLGLWGAAVVAACWIAHRAEAQLGEHDSGVIVIDEIVGYLAATLFLPPTWEVTLLAFVVFRALDVLKPFPAGWIDRELPGGAGVVLDDVVSGLYSNVVTRVLAALFFT